MATVRAVVVLFAALALLFGPAPATAAPVSVRLPITGAVAPCPGAGQKIVNPGFEQGQTGWTSTPGVIGQWGPGRQLGGTWSAWLDGYGTTHTDTLSQTVTLPAGCTSYVLTFWLTINTADPTALPHDRLTVRLGSTILAGYSNLNRAPGFMVKNFAVNAFAGQTVTLLFTGIEDATLQTSFLLDDVTLTVS
jgi:hypothetical protein